MPLNCKIGKKMKSKKIHCPVSGCLYFSGSERHFTEKKFLNQHIAKVHAEKKYSCSKCQKCFGTDWWCKHHEKTCGMEWKCDECGGNYTCRESLLTHARRTRHKLPDHVLNNDKVKPSKASLTPKEIPTIILIQPIIQNLTCIQPVKKALISPRPILPKIVPPILFNIPVSVGMMNTMYNSVYSSPAIQESSSLIPLPNPSLPSANSTADVASSFNQNKLQRTISTQTLDDFECGRKSRESRASQCSRRKSKRTPVGIESTHTQTAESAVVKIKRKRSRRKSVAITTESSMLMSSNSGTGQSLWPDFKDLILPNTDSYGCRGVKNTTSTQTSNCKVLCDSQTITDDDLFKLIWDEDGKDKDSSICCNSPFGMLPDIAVEDVTLPEDLNHNNLPILNMFTSTNSMTDTVLNHDIKNHSGVINNTVPTVSNTANNKELSDKTCSLFSVFEDSSKMVADIKAIPTLSDIHTQTMASAVLDYHLLANMETQTTDDFSLLDLEFSDTETQTPWDDFPNIDDSPLPADQLSIEIQTDFPLLTNEIEQDPYDFINGFNMHGMIENCSNKELGVNIETQTQDGFTFPQFTNTESQTLDLKPFTFSSLNSS